MRFTVNETATGITAPPKDICKVQGCTKGRFKKRGGNVFCKPHSGLRTQMSKKKFKELVGNNELVVVEGNWPPKNAMKVEVVAFGEKKTVNITSKKKKMRALRKAILA